MSEAVKFGVRVPAAVKEQFEAAVDEKWPHRDNIASVELEREVRAFIDEGLAADLETEVDRLVEATGRATNDGQSSAESAIAGTTSGGSVKVVNYQIRADVCEAFKAKCKSAAESIKWVISGIMLDYAERQGVLGRALDKLSRVASDAEQLLSRLGDDTDESLPKSRRLTIKLANAVRDRYGDDGEMPNQIHKNMFVKMAEEFEYPDTRVEHYAEKAIGRLDLVEHPDASQAEAGSFVTPEHKRTLIEQEREQVADEADDEADGLETATAADEPSPTERFAEDVAQYRKYEESAPPREYIDEWLAKYDLDTPPESVDLDNWSPDELADETDDEADDESDATDDIERLADAVAPPMTSSGQFASSD